MFLNRAKSENRSAVGAPSIKKTVWVRETRFGRWFLSTPTWYRYVLSQAFIDFRRLIRDRLPRQPKVLDAGCGQGLSFSLLENFFQPSEIVGIDIDHEQIAKANIVANNLSTPAQVIHANAGVPLFNESEFDLVFCHQLLHHTSQQVEVLSEFYRILKPGGVLLVGESCRSFINSAPVRLLFRHPKMVQKDAQGYIDIVRAAGFLISTEDVQFTRPWWSRRSLGLAQKLGIGKRDREPTEVLIVATKPL